MFLDVLAALYKILLNEQNNMELQTLFFSSYFNQINTDLTAI